MPCASVLGEIRCRGSEGVRRAGAGSLNAGAMQYNIRLFKY